MKEPLYKKYANTEPKGVLPLCNFGGIEVLDYEGSGGYFLDDILITCFNFGTGRQQIRRHKKNITDGGAAYIRIYGKRYYLDDFQWVRHNWK
mgnify:CR=1 FL=1